MKLNFTAYYSLAVLHLNYVRMLFNLGIPLVTVDHYYDSLQLDAVVTANAEEAYKIVTHLIDKGHQQIGFIGAISRTKKASGNAGPGTKMPCLMQGWQSI